MNDSLGDRMKWYERRYSQVAMPTIPIIARIDGRAFHTFTTGLARPYDPRLSELMVNTTRFLIQETDARCGYTQSDEISLVWFTETPHSETFFGGEISKLISVVASLATAYFNKHLPVLLPEKREVLATFDNRVWELPNATEAANYFVWREKDATRNSISMAARSVYSHTECHKKKSAELQEMLFQKGINWNDYPNFFKRGTYVRRRSIERPFTPDELSNLPPQHHARTNPGMVYKRSVVMAENFPPLTKIVNRADVIVFGSDPITEDDIERKIKAAVLKVKEEREGE